MIIEVIVKANAKKSGVVKVEGGKVWVEVKAPPEQDRANREVVKVLAKKFKCVPVIVRGLSSKKKWVRITSF